MAGGSTGVSPLNSQHSLFQLFHDVSITFTISLPPSLASSSFSLPHLFPVISSLLSLLLSSPLFLDLLLPAPPRHFPLFSHPRFLHFCRTLFGRSPPIHVLSLGLSAKVCWTYLLRS